MEKATFGLDENVASAACYVLGWLTGIIFFVVEKDNKTVRFHAMQSILTFIGLTIVMVILNVIVGILAFGAAMATGGFGLLAILSLFFMLVGLVCFLLWLFLMWKAYSGEKFLVPIVGAIAESQVK
jgi:uncharacterized membrane protein